MKNQLGLKIGDSVIVKQGITDPDSGISISGWQGRIDKFEKSDEDEATILITLDSITLKSLPTSYIEECEENGYDWSTYYLGLADVEPAKARDTKRDVTKAIEEVENQIGWRILGGEEGRRIQKVLSGIDMRDEWGLLEAWDEYLEEHLSFPFEAEIFEYQRGRLKTGDKLSVTGIADTDDKYGILVNVKKGPERLVFPLCDLKVIGKNASKSNKQIVSDYAVWFANR